MTELWRCLRKAIRVLVFIKVGAAQIAPLITNINARQTTSLDGQWHTIVDPYDAGAFDYHSQPLTNQNAFYKNYKPKSKSELVEYDFDSSAQLHVPGDWNTRHA
jgi:beta-glucuronidase